MASSYHKIHFRAQSGLAVRYIGLGGAAGRTLSLLLIAQFVKQILDVFLPAGHVPQGLFKLHPQQPPQALGVRHGR